MSFGGISNWSHNGKTPFYSPLNSEIPGLVLSGKIHFPPHVSESAKSLIKGTQKNRKNRKNREIRLMIRIFSLGLLTKKITKRLGCDKNGVEGVKNHPFFSVIDWEGLLTASPPIKISLAHDADTKYFE